VFQSVKRYRVLPRPAKPQYFGYGHILDRLTSCLLWEGNPLSRSQVICVLSGMGGVGKSETILQFLAKNAPALHER
jgi:Mrp family chromosome partitioning ATPase